MAFCFTKNHFRFINSRKPTDRNCDGLFCRRCRNDKQCHWSFVLFCFSFFLIKNYGVNHSYYFSMGSGLFNSSPRGSEKIASGIGSNLRRFSSASSPPPQVNSLVDYPYLVHILVSHFNFFYKFDVYRGCFDGSTTLQQCFAFHPPSSDHEGYDPARIFHSQSVI